MVKNKKKHFYKSKEKHHIVEMQLKESGSSKGILQHY
jgi:hypothetical protein